MQSVKLPEQKNRNIIKLCQRNVYYWAQDKLYVTYEYVNVQTKIMCYCIFTDM